MKRHLGKKNNLCQKEIVTREKEYQEKSCIENAKVVDLAERLLKGNELTIENINELAKRIAKKQGYEEDVIIVCNIVDLSEQLKLHQKSEKPLFVICSNENTKIIFSIVKLSGRTICLFRDLLDIKISNEVKDVIELQIAKDVVFRIYAKVEEIKNQKDMDILSLKAIETIMINLKSDDLKKRNDFIEGFDNPNKTFFEWIKEKISKLRDQLFELIQEDYEKITGSDLDQLALDSEFKSAIGNFLNNIPLLGEVETFQNYQNLLKQCAEMEENDDNSDSEKFQALVKQLEEAQKEIINKTGSVKIDTSTNNKGEQELHIVTQFPKQMEKFTRIFEPLVRAEVDDKLDARLREISLKLNVDYKLLKSFFHAKKNEKENNPESNQQSKSCSYDLPKYKLCDDKELDIKSLKQLLSETQCDDIESIEKNFNKVKDFSKLWKEKKATDIKNWAVMRKGSLSYTEIYETLAVMDRANSLATGGHKLRDTQLIALLVFVQTKDMGQLSEIKTGEGKTTIVAILAAIKALQGSKVDVITSNPVLAADGVKDKERFFSLLSLSVKTNNFDESYKTGERQCYEADIVYGSIANFQFDYLKDSFLDLRTRAGRPFDTIILDEVDSMIIDNANHIAKLSGPFPGMDSLKFVYIKIWQELYKAERLIVAEYEKDMKLKIQELQKLPENEANQEYEKFVNTIESSIIPRIKKSIKASNPSAIDIIPSHIREYANNSVDRWIYNALEAKFTYNEDQQYVIRNHNGEAVVQPVDYANTGITMKNTIWQYGLHQFLQLYHNLQLTSESLTSCFISNLGYINKYGRKIYGLTGTLGSEAEQELLSSIYHVGFAKIPTFREKKFEEIEGEAVDDDIFSQVVTEDVICEIKNGRSCLVICETIKDAKAIQKDLKATGNDIRIRTFFDEDNAKATEEELSPGEVVIATNIAGRGTDFKTTKELEKHGGLHVCVAFLPCNKRVEDQAFGRTARQGNEGTAKLIMKQSEILDLGVDTEIWDYMKLIKDKRDLREKERIKCIKNEEVPKLNFQDDLFQRFANLHRNLKNEKQFQSGYQSVLDDLKELWAFWLEKKNFSNTDLSKTNPSREFEEFKSLAAAQINGEIQSNPYYAIQQADGFLSFEKYDDAAKSLHHAIKLSDNPDLLHGAYMKLFEIEIEKGHVFMDKCRQAIGDLFFISAIKPDGKYKENARHYLVKAKEALKKEFDYIEKLQKEEGFGNIILPTDEKRTDMSYWYSDDDMNKAGTTLLKSLGIDTDKQFRNRLTKDQLEIFCKEYILSDETPVFICYNIGGTSNQNGGDHWVNICIIKMRDQMKILYKDSKGDFEENSLLIKEEVAKYWNKIDFIQHTGIEQTDDASCGPMTLANLKLMAQSLKTHGVEKFIKTFQNLQFCQQKDVAQLREEFVNNLPNEGENLFLKHLSSRRSALNLYIEHINNLIERIDKCKQGDGLSISLRTPDYFVNLKPQNDNERIIKNSVTNTELEELADLGTNTIYDLKEMYKVCDEVVKGARIQIVGGLGLIATGIVFPLSLPVLGPIGGTMITEGVCDIAMDLIAKSNDGKFNKAAYIKGKVISYGISLLTLGISAALQCPKILNKAKRACRWIAKTLRKCPYMKNICERIATKFDTLGKLFEKMEVVAKFSKMNNIEKLKYIENLEKTKNFEHLKYLGQNINQIDHLRKLEKAGKLRDLTRYEKCMTTLKQVAITTGKGIAMRTAENVIMSKIVTPQLSSMLSGLKPEIRKYVEKSVKENIDKEKLKYCNQEDLQKIMQEIRDSIDYEAIMGIFREAILGISKHCSNWRVQLCALALDQYVSWKKVYDYTKDLCIKINQKIKTTEKTNANIDEIINQLTDQLAEEMYSHVVSNTAKTCKDVSTVGVQAFMNYKKERKEIRSCMEIIKEFKDGGVAGQEQATAVSDVLKRPIHIYEENGNVVIIGKQYPGEPIKVTYHPPDENNPNGHYVPYGEDRDWSAENVSTNNCFFEAVGKQIKTDPIKLRQNTVTRMERHPKRYIAIYARNVLGSNRSNVFMEGGRNHVRMTEDFYPSHNNRIKASNELNSEIAELRNELNKVKRTENKYKKLGRSKQFTNTKNNKSHPKFGNVPDKDEMMMGAFRVKFTDGSELKLVTVSGDTPFCDRESVNNPQDLPENQTSKPIPFEWTSKKGFKFTDPGKPQGKVYDVFNKCETNYEFTKSCAAQKFIYTLGEHMKNNPNLVIKDILNMSESWYKPTDGTFKPQQIIMDKSCEYCEKVLPFATGQKGKK
uniref:Putative preprotein translocase subunit seca n=1 Tax=Nyssomyia neivai TaxID=330878 RepID=A0A1L8DFD7_9DIPT